MLDEKVPGFVSRTQLQRLRTAYLSALVFLAAAMTEAAPPEGRTLLSESVHPGDLSQVKALLEVEGQLKLKPGGTTAQDLPLKITGKFLYDELRLPTGKDESTGGLVASVRHYHRAEALFEVNREQRTSLLPVANRLIVVGHSGSVTTIGCPFGPLTREHNELIDIPGNSLLLSGLLPADAVAPNEPWDIGQETLQGLLGWDTISDCQVQGTLNSVKDGSATIEYEGTAGGRVSGAATSVELKAKCVFDLEAGHIRWFGAALRENREAGPAEPGFYVTARLQMAISQLDNSEPLSEAGLAGLALSPSELPPPLTIESRYAGCRLLADQRWYVIVDRHDTTVLRFVDNGEAIAQCNITSMPDLAPGKHVLLDAFQQDIQKTLGSNFGQFVDASQWRTDEGLRVLRVSAAGVVSDVTVQWIYYLISDEKGRRTAVVFTLDQENAERFATADQTLASSFQFLDRAPPKEPRVTDQRPAEETGTE
jgi:hypothetical protein